MPFIEPSDMGPKPWGTETLLSDLEARKAGYELKRLVYEAGHQGALQYHPGRIETFHLHEGKAIVFWSDPDKALHSRVMTSGETFHVPRGTPHKFHAIQRCVVFEASNGTSPASVNAAEQLGDQDGEAR